MKVKSTSANNKLLIGLAVLLALMAGFIWYSYQTFGHLVENSASVIRGNELLAAISRKDVDILTWNNDLNALLRDGKNTGRRVEADDHACSFGQWLYGPGRKNAETFFPALAPRFSSLEKPHAAMHSSAEKIMQVRQQDTAQFETLLQQVGNEQQNWMNRINDALLENSTSSLEDLPVDPSRCTLGKWMYADETKALIQSDPVFARQLRELEPLHKRLHGSIADIRKFVASGDRLGAVSYYKRAAEPVFRKTALQLDAILQQQKAAHVGNSSPDRIYAEETLPALLNVLAVLADTRKEIRNQITADQRIGAEAGTTRQRHGIIGAIVMVLGVFTALITARALSSPPLEQKSSQEQPTGRTPSLRQQEKTAAKFAMMQKQGAELPRMQGAAEELSSSVHAVNSSFRELQTALAEISTSAEQQNKNTSALREEFKKLRESGESAAEAAGMHDEVINRLMSTADTLEEAIREGDGRTPEPTRTSAAIGQDREASEFSGQLSELVETMTEMTEQINLLSLNASIEAARAGSHGTNFAYIAEEVGRLAERSSAAVREISARMDASGNASPDLPDPDRRTGKTPDQEDHRAGKSVDSNEHSSTPPIPPTSEIHDLARRLRDTAAAMTSRLSVVNSSAAEIEEEIRTVVDQSSAQGGLVAQSGQYSTAIADALAVLNRKADELAGFIREYSAAAEKKSHEKFQNSESGETVIFNRIRSDIPEEREASDRTPADRKEVVQSADAPEIYDGISADAAGRKESAPNPAPGEKKSSLEKAKAGRETGSEDLMKKRLKKAIAKYSKKR